MGSADRIIRLLAGAVLMYLAYTNVLAGGWIIAAWIVGGIFVLTSLTGRCPLYSLFGIRTNHQVQ